MWFITYLYLIAFSFLLSLLCVKGSIGLALKTHLFDDLSPRKLQKKPVPLLGGLGIMGAFFGTVFFNVILLSFFKNSPVFQAWIPQDVVRYIPGALSTVHKLFFILLGSLIVFFVGLIDDIVELGAWPKLIVQIIAALFLFFSGIRITLFTHVPGMSLFLTVLWVVAITNAFNLLDNMDGLSAGIAVISGLFLLVISMAEGQYFVSLFLCVFIGSVLGFLIFNFHPARVFMGDAGSYLLGFLMASMTILGTYYRRGGSTSFSILMPVLVLGVPLYDLLSVILIRLHQKRPIFKGDKTHFSHRLVHLGMSQRGAVLFLYLVSFAFGTSSLLLGMIEPWGFLFIFLQASAFVMIIAMLEYFGRIHST
ncbi:MAG: undecaprenyl/decaprenyl-phosphate alpha-N-acetylglucosaminyl 1-phosphate transferase [Chlamydiae bacterium]|nr:undecaprenyl/decaprenyl-phosphate alpha-N-acetylglucosaminyl 1-phosphate transferase [Chlamydiota bacterium]MBI3277296.1 undecaprenyl/decaprenyl-phosphate alpha-N-acetylglucosaminyl 1-phosphate transferase [Chlamydiota bacterium]